MWKSMDGKTMEAELVAVIAAKAVLKMAQRKQRKVLLSQLSAEDRECIELARPPEFDISFSRQINPVLTRRICYHSGGWPRLWHCDFKGAR